MYSLLLKCDPVPIEEVFADIFNLFSVDSEAIAARFSFLDCFLAAFNASSPPSAFHFSISSELPAERWMGGGNYFHVKRTLHR